MNLCFFFQSLRWGGPLSQNWLDQQLVLQKKILSRMIELGMVPGMVCFTVFQYLTNSITFIPPCHLIFQVSYIWSSVYLFPLLCVDKVERATHFFLAIFNYYNAINTVLRFVLTVHYYFTVLPSFSGNVPAVFSKLFPSANITRLGDW